MNCLVVREQLGLQRVHPGAGALQAGQLHRPGSIHELVDETGELVILKPFCVVEISIKLENNTF